MAQPYSFGGGVVRPAPVPTKRRVFFSFHYQADINRANIVRNSWVTRKGEDNQAFGFYDASLWESSQRQGPESIKALIRDGLENTSVTCVLVGFWTYSRRWVRYEIARSVARGNGLLAVRIHGLKCMKSQTTTSPGPNPFLHLGLCRKQDGQAYLCELDGTQWKWYSDHVLHVAWPRFLPQPQTNVVQPLSTGVREYDYASPGSYERFPVWVSLSAAHAGR